MLNWFSNLKWNFGFIEAGNAFTETLIDFYNLICVYLILVVFLLGYWMFYILKNHTFKKKLLLNALNFDFFFSLGKSMRYYINTSLKDRNFSYVDIYDIKDHPELEGRWCSAPLMFVGSVAYPSTGLEYGISPDLSPAVVVKVTANQWYWVLDIETSVSPGLIEGLENNSDFFLQSDLYKLFVETYGDQKAFMEGLENLEYMTLTKRVEVNLVNENPSFFRLLSVDSKIILPINTSIKFVITSIDVLHAFALPAFALKVDAVPGRLSEQMVYIEQPGLFWGQCSELCGPYHGFMPIVIEATTYPVFLKSFN